MGSRHQPNARSSRRRHRSSRRVRRALVAVLFGGLLFGVAGGLLALLALELDHGRVDDSEPADSAQAEAAEGKEEVHG